MLKNKFLMTCVKNSGVKILVLVVLISCSQRGSYTLTKRE